MRDNSLETPEFKIRYDESAHSLQFEGEVRLLRSVLVERFTTLLNRSLDYQASLVLWDFSRLTYLDSTAEYCLYARLARMRRKENLVVRVVANDSVRIQQKLIPNLKQFFPATDIYYVESA